MDRWVVRPCEGAPHRFDGYTYFGEHFFPYYKHHYPSQGEDYDHGHDHGHEYLFDFYPIDPEDYPRRSFFLGRTSTRSSSRRGRAPTDG